MLQSSLKIPGACFTYLFIFESTPGNSQGFLPDLHSEITPDSVLGTRMKCKD